MRTYPRDNSKSSHHVIAAPPLTCPYIEDLIPQSDHTHYFSRLVTRSHVEGVTSPPNVTKTSVADSESSRDSQASSHGKTARRSDFIPITKIRSVKDVPLPYSRLTTSATDEREESKAGKSSVSPKQSVSQVSTRRLGEN